MSVLLTGATGFVGATLARRWAERGRPWTGLVRAGADVGALPGNADLVRGDLTDPRAVDAAVRRTVERARELGTSADVVHAGALISYRTRDADEARRVNVEGTRYVIEACAAHGVRRLLHVSSVVAVGHAPDASTSLDESAAFSSGGLGVHYVTTKRAAEDLALAAVPELEVVVACPGAIFGPAHRPTNTRRFLETARGGLPGPWAPPGSLAVVGVDDVARGLDLALERGRDRRRYLLTESNWTLVELLAETEARAGARRRRRRPAPGSVWRLVVAAAGALDRVRPLGTVTPQSLELLGLHYRFDSRRAREELGWSPRPFREVLAETLAWLDRDAARPA